MPAKLATEGAPWELISAASYAGSDVFHPPFPTLRCGAVNGSTINRQSTAMINIHGRDVTTNEAAKQSDRTIAPCAAKRSLGETMRTKHLACEAGDRRHYSTASYAGSDVFHARFPTLRFAAHGAIVLSDCFAASILWIDRDNRGEFS
jgi:hypothetical protein